MILPACVVCGAPVKLAQHDACSRECGNIKARATRAVLKAVTAYRRRCRDRFLGIDVQLEPGPAGSGGGAECASGGEGSLY